MNKIARITSPNRLSVEEYLAFIAPRPSEERWQLIDGIAILMNPSTLRHQSVGRNLLIELQLHYRAEGLPFSALYEVGLIVPDVDKFRPECDVAVVDEAVDLDANYADRFFLVAEIRSDSNTDAEIDLKRVRYMQHPDNLYCLVISQTEVKVELWARAGGWQRTELTRLDQAIELPAFGCAIGLAALYRGTGVGEVRI